MAREIGAVVRVSCLLQLTVFNSVSQGYFECSALTQDGLKRVFDYAAKAVLLEYATENKKEKCIMM